ncbi:uncharacterized protein NEMAJ01_1776 [Nematocida major]|uniref:uncharacterized protein n=1 Tax=Nematocida major TaxID=1912982 RepID=UPI00200795B1|nr:uncharacterized protein NEMAJ01_1776 [Nematocida major]KAH9386880.1 hypothetical protein NEMAJ01_1776 [Nematocida major]
MPMKEQNIVVVDLETAWKSLEDSRLLRSFAAGSFGFNLVLFEAFEKNFVLKTPAGLPKAEISILTSLKRELLYVLLCDMGFMFGDKNSPDFLEKCCLYVESKEAEKKILALIEKMSFIRSAIDVSEKAESMADVPMARQKSLEALQVETVKEAARLVEHIALLKKKAIQPFESEKAELEGSGAWQEEMAPEPLGNFSECKAFLKNALEKTLNALFYSKQCRSANMRNCLLQGISSSLSLFICADVTNALQNIRDNYFNGKLYLYMSHFLQKNPLQRFSSPPGGPSPCPVSAANLKFGVFKHILDIHTFLCIVMHAPNKRCEFLGNLAFVDQKMQRSAIDLERIYTAAAYPFVYRKEPALQLAHMATALSLFGAFTPPFSGFVLERILSVCREAFHTKRTGCERHSARRCGCTSSDAKKASAVFKGESNQKHNPAFSGTGAHCTSQLFLAETFFSLATIMDIKYSSFGALDLDVFNYVNLPSLSHAQRAPIQSKPLSLHRPAVGTVQQGRALCFLFGFYGVCIFFFSILALFICAAYAIGPCMFEDSKVGSL